MMNRLEDYPELVILKALLKHLRCQASALVIA